MIEEKVIVAVTAMSSLCFVFIFRRFNSRTKKEHHLKISALENEFLKHQEQITLRIKYLKLYDFLRYNLTTSLYKQPQISLSLRR